MDCREDIAEPKSISDWPYFKYSGNDLRPHIHLLYKAFKNDRVSLKDYKEEPFLNEKYAKTVRKVLSQRKVNYFGNSFQHAFKIVIIFANQGMPGVQSYFNEVIPNTLEEKSLHAWRFFDAKKRKKPKKSNPSLSDEKLAASAFGSQSHTAKKIFR